ncbi:MAG: tRNA (guanosine(37)-N1)-methyltransferase TrmD [Chloroflexota bacterium]|nr:tRNA (guanosine(37)-N1)-methyltransferase TrmD [Chloroflexota bacterium]
MTSSLRVDILTLFPEMCTGVLGSSILKRGMQAGYLGVRLHQIREYTHDRHHTVDDYPYGGGAGMVMKAPPLFEAVEAVQALPPGLPGLYLWHKDAEPETLVAPTTDLDPPTAAEDPQYAIIDTAEDPPLNTQHSTLNTPIILMSPAGRVFTQAIAAELAALPRLILVCGHYEGVDERVRAHLITEELSVGDYVLTGGELAALVIVDAVARLIPGVLAEGSAADESHSAGLLEYPQYTRPAGYRGWDVPPILISGHHARVAEWRQRESLHRTLAQRPDLLAGRALSKQERAWLAEFQAAPAGEDTDG